MRIHNSIRSSGSAVKSKFYSPEAENRIHELLSSPL
jgi:hypothetical protein